MLLDERNESVANRAFCLLMSHRYLFSFQHKGLRYSEKLDHLNKYLRLLDNIRAKNSGQTNCEVL